MDELADDEQRAWVVLLGVLTWLPPALDDELRATAGISHLEYQVLWWLAAAEDGRLHMGTLAECSQVTASHLSRIVTRLENRGEVRRGPDPDDGRFMLAALTEVGRRRVDQCLPHYMAAVQRLVFARLSPGEVGSLESISRALLAGVRPQCTNPVPMAPGALPGPGVGS